MNQLWFLTSNVLALAISCAAASAAFGAESLPKFVLATAAGFSLVAVGAVLLTGIFGILAIQWVVLLLLVVAVCGWLIPGLRTRIIRNYYSVVSTQRNETRTSVPWLRELAIILTVVCVMLPLARCFILGTNFGSDDLSYHGPAIAEWIVRQGVVLAPFDYHAYYPFNAEAFAAWFILPYHSDGLIGLAGAYWLALLWLATVSLVQALGGSRTHGAITGAVIMAAPLIGSMGNRISSPDIAGVAMVLAAIVFLAPDARRTPSISRGSAIYAGLFLGFALGCKVSFGVAIAIVLAWLLLSPGIAPRLLSRARIGFIILVCGMLAGGGWYLRNWLLTGNPVFPAQVGPYEGPFTMADQARTKLITWILEQPTDARQWGSIFQGILNWPPSLWSVSLVGYLVASWDLLRKRITEPPCSLQRLLILLGMTSVVMFFFLPFSATYNEPYGKLDPAIRYAILPFVIGIISLGGAYATTAHRKAVFPWIALLGVITSWSLGSWSSLLIMPIAFLTPLFNRLWNQAFNAGPLKYNRWIWGGVLPFLVGVILLQPLAEYLTNQRVYEYELSDHRLGLAWKAIDTLPPGSRITWYGNKLQEYYPLYGRHLDKIPVALDPNGMPFKRLHFMYYEEHDSLSWWGHKPEIQLDKFYDNIRHAGIDYVFVSKQGGDSWPVQHNVLSESAGSTLVYDDGFSAIWKVPSDQP